jgi:hypothetical protein
MDKCFVHILSLVIPLDSDRFPTLCQNVMIIHISIDLYMKFRYSLIITDNQIHLKHQNSTEIP